MYEWGAYVVRVLKKHPRVYYSRGVIIVALRKSNEALQSSFSGLGLFQRQTKDICESVLYMNGQKCPKKAKNMKLRRAVTNP